MKRFVVESWGAAWLVLDRQTRTVVRDSVGELERCVIKAQLLNLWEAEQWKKNKIKIIKIR